jgi:hypothetical protein
MYGRNPECLCEYHPSYIFLIISGTATQTPISSVLILSTDSQLDSYLFVCFIAFFEKLDFRNNDKHLHALKSLVKYDLRTPNKIVHLTPQDRKFFLKKIQDFDWKR